MPVDKLLTKRLGESLRSRRCRCGSSKYPGRAFCSSCYFALPRPLRSELYSPLGSGYEEAHAKAIVELDEVATHEGG